MLTLSIKVSTLVCVIITYVFITYIRVYHNMEMYLIIQQLVWNTVSEIVCYTLRKVIVGILTA